MHDPFLRGADQSRFGFRHGGDRPGAVARGDRFLDFARCRTHARTPRLIDDGPARSLSSGFLCGFRIGHNLPNTDIHEGERGL